MRDLSPVPHSTDPAYPFLSHRHHQTLQLRERIAELEDDVEKEGNQVKAVFMLREVLLVAHGQVLPHMFTAPSLDGSYVLLRVSVHHGAQLDVGCWPTARLQTRTA